MRCKYIAKVFFLLFVICCCDCNGQKKRERERSRGSGQKFLTRPRYYSLLNCQFVLTHAKRHENATKWPTGQLASKLAQLARTGKNQSRESWTQLNWTENAIATVRAFPPHCIDFLVGLILKKRKAKTNFELYWHWTLTGQRQRGGWIGIGLRVRENGWWPLSGHKTLSVDIQFLALMAAKLTKQLIMQPTGSETQGTEVVH